MVGVGSILSNYIGTVPGIYHRGLIMVKGFFKIDVRGRPKSRDDIAKLRPLLHSRILMIDSAAKSDQVWFGKLSVILTWEGVPKYLGQGQSLFHLLEKNVGKYFLAYKFSIIISFEETG